MVRPRFQYLLCIWFFYDCMDKPFMIRCVPSFLNAVRSRVKPNLLATKEHEIATNEREAKERVCENQNRNEQAKGDPRNSTRRAEEIADEYAIGKAKETPNDSRRKININSLLN
ncbi:hypothetical protein N7G274_007101 [Stereocaulon virgatum]|uniref:Uncharacterized protein n=1 Tax=Stereocaulon virgatum TaxID=373712 RepID=A0ABR4A3F6_9LECA